MANLNPVRERIWLLSKELMLAASPDGTILATNPSWGHTLGWGEAELRSMKFHELVHPDDLQATIEATNSCVRGSAAGQFDNRCRHKDGSYRLIAWSTIADGEFLYAIGRAVASGTHSAGAHESVEELNRGQKIDAVSRFSGVIAHDFNNLLQGIVGSMELVRKLIKMGRAEETERFIDNAMAAVKRAATLTSRLHVFSSRPPPEPQAVELNGLINSMEDVLRRSLTPSIDLKLALSAGLWTTRCDPGQLENAMLNLVNNARDAMPDGGTLLIESSNVDVDDSQGAGAHAVAPGQYICIAVTDTGTGMGEEVIQQAFDPLFTTKPAGMATGLGLSMVFGFTQQLQGYARIDSEIGRGTTVKLYLPRSRGADARRAMAR